MTVPRAEPPLHVNGKWLAHELSGTERYAGEIVRRLAASRRGGVLHLPADAEVPAWADGWTVRRSRARGQVFEQIVLPVVTLGRPLLNLAGPAPLLKRRQLAAMHDASVFALGSTYHWTFRLWYRTMYRMLARTARVAVTVSRFSAVELARATGTTPDRFQVVPNGADHLRSAPDRVLPDLALPDRPYVLLVGGNIPHKNTHWAVEALAPLDVPVVVVGKIRASRQFSDSGEPGSDGARWVGRISDEALQTLYAHALCLVFPSRYEGFGIPVLEAQATSCPVVCSDAASLPEVAGDGALFFSTDSPEQLRDAVTRLRDDPESRADLIRRGHENLRRYTWDASAERVAQLVARL